MHNAVCIVSFAFIELLRNVYLLIYSNYGTLRVATLPVIEFGDI